MKTLWDRLKIGSNGESWQPTFLKKTAPDYDDDDHSTGRRLGHGISWGPNIRCALHSLGKSCDFNSVLIHWLLLAAIMAAQFSPV